MLFVDRVDAGRQLADRLRELASDDLVVLALPRGGVPVAAEVARRLGAPLDIIVVRKLGVPCNDFGAQEPGSEGEIKTFCETRFAVDFPLTAKEHVIGAEAHPLYKWVAAELGEGAAPKWNFHKYLFAPDGTIAGTFGSRTEPNAPEIAQAIDKALA